MKNDDGRDGAGMQRAELRNGARFAINLRFAVVVRSCLHDRIMLFKDAMEDYLYRAILSPLVNYVTLAIRSDKRVFIRIRLNAERRSH